MLNNKNLRITYREMGFGVLCIIFALTVNGAIPFLTAPTLGQALWISGFGYSFSNESLLAVHATNMGYPLPAPIAFGLSGAYPSGILIAAGVNAIDAYTLVVTGWLVTAFMGATALARSVGNPRSTSFLMATMWLCLPVVWGHAGYSMTAVGMALMPFYLWTIVRILNAQLQSYKRFALDSFLYAAACLISAFTDGYTFVMFAVAASTCIGIALLAGQASRTVALRIVPVHIAAFGISYMLYKAYFPYVDANLASLDFFRGWGADISYLIVPTCQTVWFADYFDLCGTRVNSLHYGDSSVWRTTYSLPILFTLLVLSLWKRPRGWLAVACLFYCLFAFYMALGPTLKFFTEKSVPNTTIQLMTASQGWFDTGSGWISKSIPGFSSMRASYRWVVLGLLGSWLLLAMCLAQLQRHRIVSTLVPALIIALVIPAPARLSSTHYAREQFWLLENSLIADFAANLRPGEKVAFLPYRNDFLVNYLAPRTGIRAFNIGGDKNLYAASLHWPDEIQELTPGQTGPQFDLHVMAFLESGQVDAIVLPYIDLLVAAHKWPVANTHEKELSKVASQIAENQRYQVVERPYYALVRLNQGLSPLGRANFIASLPPIDLASDVQISKSRGIDAHLFGRGWHPAEELGVWSKEMTSSFRVDTGDIPDEGSLEMSFWVYTPGESCTTLHIRTEIREILSKRYCGPVGLNSVSVTKDSLTSDGKIEFLVDTLRSPSESGSADSRKLGVSLQSLKVKSP